MITRWARWRAVVRIASGDARRARGRTALVAALIGLPILLGTAGVTLLMSAVPTTAETLDDALGTKAAGMVGAWWGSDAQYQNAEGLIYSGGDVDRDGAPTLADHEQAIQDALPDARLVRTLTTNATPRSDTASIDWPIEINSIPSDQIRAIVTLDLAEGRLPARPGELLISHQVAERFNVGLAEHITFTADDSSETTLTVTGVLGPAPDNAPWFTTVTGSFGPEPALATGAGTYPRWYVFTEQPITWDQVQHINTLGSVVTSRAVALDPDAYGAPRALTSAPSSDSITVGAVVAVIVVLEAVLLIGPAFSVGAQRSRRQLALLAAVGAEQRDLRGVVLWNAVVIALLSTVAASLLGIALAAAIRFGVNAARPFTFRSFQMPWWLLPAGIALGVAVAAIAAWIPARRAGRLDVTAALAGRRDEARSSRWLPIVGAALALSGSLVAVAGATSGQFTLVVVGVLGLELGVIAAAGFLVSLAARVAPHLRTAGRFALRDAARQRSRTAPAVAAIIAAVAGMTAAASYTASGTQANLRAYAPWSGEGVVTANHSWEEETVWSSAEELDAMTSALTENLPVDKWALATYGSVPATERTDTEADNGWAGVVTVPPPEAILDCPGNTADIIDPLTGMIDPRCTNSAWYSGSNPGSLDGTVMVDDGTVVQMLGLPGAELAAQALARGEVVVQGGYLIDEGMVNIEAFRENIDGERDALASYRGPAIAVNMVNYHHSLILPPEVARQLNLDVAPTGVVGTTTRMPTKAEERAAAGSLSEAVTKAEVNVERGPGSARESLAVWILYGAAALVGLGASLLSVALAQAETRPDLATLAAVGATPGIRRRISAAQTGVLTLTGVPLGVATGLLLARVLVTTRQYSNGEFDVTWQLTIPWDVMAATALGIPLLTMSIAWLTTRSRLPLVRRIGT